MSVIKPFARSKDMPVPKSVAIVAMGDSAGDYLRAAATVGDRRLVADETWCVNSMGSAIQHDLLFHMDDLKVQETKTDWSPYVKGTLAYLKTHPFFLTSKAYDDYPGSHPYPLDKVLKAFGVPYLNTTAAYAIAYALLIGVEKLLIFGFDFTYPNLHQGEQGRGCVEYWLGVATARGVQVVTGPNTTLLDAAEPWSKKIYGYGGYNVSNEQGEIVLRPKESSEQELRYKFGIGG